MSEVIQDIEFTSFMKSPYYALANALKIGVFSNRISVHYSDDYLNLLIQEDIDACYEFVTRITLQKLELSLQSSLLKNRELFVVNSREVRKNLYRSFLKTKVIEPKMKIVINQEGRLCFKMHTFLSSQLQFKQTKQVLKLYKYIQVTYKEMITYFKQVFLKVKVLIQPIFQKSMTDNQEKLERLDIMKNTCRFTYVEPSFMKTDGKRGKDKHQNLRENFSPQEQFAITSFYDMKVESERMTDDKKYQLFIELWEQSFHLQKVEDTQLYKNFPLVKIKDIYKPDPKQIEQKNKIAKVEMADQLFTKIKINNFEKVQWTKMYQGGFGTLYKGSISFEYARGPLESEKIRKNEKNAEKIVVMKTDKGNKNKISRINIQRQILTTLKGKKCKYLPKFYETQQKNPDFPNFILTDYYPHKSLDNWLRNYGEFTSIFTKISMLSCIFYGLHFLHQNNIVHRDIKLPNILVDSKMIAKITDFGQSYHESIDQLLGPLAKNHRPGVTLPYGAPQVFVHSDRKIKQKTYDMFSLGFIIYEVLFNERFFQYSNEQQLKKMFFEEVKAHHSKGQEGRSTSLIKQRIHLSIQEICFFGPIQILTPVLNIVQRCLDSKTANRPHLLWVTGIIKQVYNNLMDFYSI